MSVVTTLNANISEILLRIAGRATSLLSEQQSALQKVKWSDGESNTDTEFSELACKCAESAWLQVRVEYPGLETVQMSAVKPDVNCTFSSEGGEVIKANKTKIELKSSKSYIMPGSTIGKLDINQPLIYCCRPAAAEGVYEVRCGQYHQAMGESEYELFQDRTPRPPINFGRLPVSPTGLSYSEKKKDDWIPHYGSCAVARIRASPSAVSHSWQDTLTRSIIYEAIKNVNTMDDLIKLRESLGTSLKSTAPF
jgi:hypothetical protein